VTIGEQTKQWFDENEGEGAFSAALLRCFLFGSIVLRPELVLLGEPVLTDGKRIVRIAPDGFKPNCWFIWFAATRPTEFGLTAYDLQMEAPYPLPYVGFKRRGKIKIYSCDRIRKDIHGRSPVSTSSSAA
jgi:hypothetical protein